ncbi:hypothetical protein DYB38_007299, partial [Aphanomyces astaci]
ALLAQVLDELAHWYSGVRHRALFVLALHSFRSNTCDVSSKAWRFHIHQSILLFQSTFPHSKRLVSRMLRQPRPSWAEPAAFVGNLMCALGRVNMVTALECADTPDPVIVTLLRLSQYMMAVHQPSWSAAPPTSPATAVHMAKTITPSVLMLCDHHPSMSIRRQAASLLPFLDGNLTVSHYLGRWLAQVPPSHLLGVLHDVTRVFFRSPRDTVSMVILRELLKQFPHAFAQILPVVLAHLESSQDWLPTVLELVLEIWEMEEVTATSSSMTYALPYIHDCLVDQTPPISMLLLSACLKISMEAAQTIVVFLSEAKQAPQLVPASCLADMARYVPHQNNKPASATTNLTGTRMSNYGSTHDPRLLATSDKIELTKQTIAEADRTAKHVLVELEAQRGQFTDMKDMVNDTKVATTQANAYLKELRERHLRQKAFLWFIIVVLVVIDLFLFYYFFLRQ